MVTCLASEGAGGEEGVLEESTLGAILTALVRERTYSFLEFLEEQAVAAVKSAIREVVLELLDPTEETTLTNLVADFAILATPEGWGQFLDRLVGALVTVLRRVHGIHLVVETSLQQGEEERLEEGGQDRPGELDRLRNTSKEVMVNICDQVHERLGKLVTVRSRPKALALVTPGELVQVGGLVALLASETEKLCGRSSAGLQLSHQGQVLVTPQHCYYLPQVILYLQTFHEEQRSAVLKRLEEERWRKGGAARRELLALHPTIGRALGLEEKASDGGEELVEEVIVRGEAHTFAEAVVPMLSALSAYLSLQDQLPNARVEVRRSAWPQVSFVFRLV